MFMAVSLLWDAPNPDLDVKEWADVRFLGMNYLAASSRASGVNVMPDTGSSPVQALIRHPVSLLDSGFRPNDSSQQAAEY